MTCVLFIGQRSDWGMAFLKAMLASGFRIQAIVAASPKRWKGSSNYAAWRGEWRIFQALAGKDIPVWYVSDLRHPRWRQRLAALGAELYFCAAFPQKFPPEILSQPTRACVNIHPSLLPALAGAHPHFWAVRHGHNLTGLTAHQMTDRIDEGPILAQVAQPVEGRSYSHLFRTLQSRIPELIHLLENHFLHGAPTEALDHGLPPSRFTNNRPEDSRICWSTQDYAEIQNILRTGSAFFYFRKWKIRAAGGRAYPHPEPEAAPGMVIEVTPAGIWVSCLEGLVLIESCKIIRLPVPAPVVARLLRIRPGDTLR